ncbi:Uracil-DNA glycosylase [bioreactor metagenome]|uniref:Uracil-DNA glycosylase n=2 Tax=root TaxID=1 RepID=A0A645I975_9ZZZZ
MVFLLWGAPAQQKARLIHSDRHLILKTTHPSPLSAHRGFLGCGHFKQANEFLAQNGLEPIDWTIR